MMENKINLELFPKDFLWGASTSAHQIEGGLSNTWTKWEKETAVERSKHIPNWYDFPKDLIEEAGNLDRRCSGKACNSYEIWGEDIELLKRLGLNAYRFSIDWSRIVPQKGVIDYDALNHYVEFVKELKKNNIEPMLTCWHWPLPLWLEEEDGFFARDIDKYWSEYLNVLVEYLGNDIKIWITLNEPCVFSSMSFLTGQWPPQEKNVFKYLNIYFNVFVRLHRIGYEIIKNDFRMVGVAKNNAYIESYNRNPLNVLIARLVRFFSNELYLNRVCGCLDFIGLNYYFHQKVGLFGIRIDNDMVSDTGWWMKPMSMLYVLEDLKKYNVPIYITENGVADCKDQYRKWWIDESLGAVSFALEKGVDVRGYFYWSLLDNFEWADGFWPKFGLAEVNFETFERKVRGGGLHYSDIVREHGRRNVVKMI